MRALAAATEGRTDVSPRGIRLAPEVPFRRLPSGPSNRQGPEGRPLNFSPVRQGWDTVTQHPGAPEARHYARPTILNMSWEETGCRAYGAHIFIAIDTQPCRAVLKFSGRPSGPWRFEGSAVS